MSHYDTLDVMRDASPEQIKKAFRRKASKAHPDREGGHAVMALINVAYETLSDPVKRARYDQSGQDNLVPPLDHRAMEVIMQMFAQLIQRAPEHEDIIELLKTSIRQNQDGMERKIKEHKSEIAAFGKRLQRLKHKGKGRNFIADFIDQRVRQIGDQISQIEDSLTLGHRAVQLLQDYQDTPPERQAPAMRGVFSTSGSTSTSW